MLPRLSYSHISHITPYMTIKQSYSSNKNCSNNYSLNPFKCNFGFPGSKSLCSYSDIFSTFFVFIKCTLICQQDLKYLIQCCDLTAILNITTLYLEVSFMKILWSLWRGLQAENNFLVSLTLNHQIFISRHILFGTSSNISLTLYSKLLISIHKP